MTRNSIVNPFGPLAASGHQPVNPFGPRISEKRPNAFIEEMTRRICPGLTAKLAERESFFLSFSEAARISSPVPPSLEIGGLASVGTSYSYGGLSPPDAASPRVSCEAAR